MDTEVEIDRRRQRRRKFTYYMQVVDANTLQRIGYLLDISLLGIKIDTRKPLLVNSVYSLRLDLTPDLASKTYMVFNGRIRWCEEDKFEPNSFIAGFEVSTRSHEDATIFQRMYDQYGMDIHH